MEIKTSETYTAFGESYTITRTPAGNHYVTHPTRVTTQAAFGTRGYAVGYIRNHAQRMGA